MLQTIFLTLLTLSIAIGGGAASAWYAVRHFDGFSTLSAGEWTAYPKRGTPDADPYSKARMAREGSLPIGVGEGLPFYAFRDREGEVLIRACTYRLIGNTPAARFWTLYPADDNLEPLAPPPDILPAVHSRQIVRFPNGDFEITVSPKAQPGNWLPVSGPGAFVLVMTLYDTPVVSGTGFVDVSFPQIVKVRCDA